MQCDRDVNASVATACFPTRIARRPYARQFVAGSPGLGLPDRANALDALAVDAEILASQPAGAAHVDHPLRRVEPELEVVDEAQPACAGFGAQIIVALLDDAQLRQAAQQLAQFQQRRPAATAWHRQRCDVGIGALWVVRVTGRPGY